MNQVELALKEKSDDKKKYGLNLIEHLLGKGERIKLRMPFSEEMQSKTESYFKGTFSFYRNYAAHDGRKIDRAICLRTLVVASELNLIGASRVSFADIGGVPGLIKCGLFADRNDICRLLDFTSGCGEFTLAYYEDLKRIQF